MTAHVVSVQRHQTVSHVRQILENNAIHAVPVVDPDGHPAGIVSTADLISEELKPNTPISQVMSTKIYSVPQYDDVHIAARICGSTASIT